MARRFERFTERDVLANTYTIIDSSLVITHTKTYEEYWNETMERLYMFVSDGEYPYSNVWRNK